MNSKYAGHTPGPWWIDDSEPELQVWAGNDSFAQQIAIIPGHTELAEIRATTSLIADAPALAARVEELESELERLTPGGSEFHGNPERCLEFIQDAMKGVSSQVVKRKQAEARVEELEAALKRIAELARRPFAYPAWQVADDSRRIAEEAIELIWPD